MADENFFGDAAPAEAAPTTEDGGFTLLGDAGAPSDAAAFVGDVQEPSDMGFAAPAGGEEEMMGFAAAPEPAEDAPIILGAPPAEEPIVLEPAPVEDVAPAVVPEASAMKKFNEEWQETLNARKAEEDAAKAAMEEAAKVAMEEFQAKAAMKRDAKMAKNREDEQAKLEDIEADLENDNSWQRVSKMVDLTQDGAEGGEDTKRIRDIFILLKNEQGLAAKVGA